MGNEKENPLSGKKFQEYILQLILLFVRILNLMKDKYLNTTHICAFFGPETEISLDKLYFRDQSSRKKLNCVLIVVFNAK